jgi:hypothetical protein
MADFKVDNAKERTLCYAAGILGAWLGNGTVNTNPSIEPWQIERAVKAAHMLIDYVYAEK